MIAHRTDAELELRGRLMGRVVTRREAAVLLGYTHNSLSTLMSRHREQWPAPVGRVRVGKGWAATYDLDEMLVAAPQAVRPESVRPFRGAATVSDDEDGLLTCAECGERRRSLWRHLREAHDLTTDEYRAAHGLPASAALIADASREIQRRHGVKKAQDGALERLAPYRTPGHMAAMTEAGREAGKASWASPIAAANWLPGQQRGVRAMLSSYAKRMDAIARAAGYTDLAAAIRATQDLTAAEAARRIGVSPQTVRRRRQTLQG